MFILYMLGVLLFFIVGSSLLAVTRFGARGEIGARGAANVSLVVHKIANGTATLTDKFLIVAMTAFGAFLSPMWLIASAAIGGLLYLVFEIWF